MLQDPSIFSFIANLISKKNELSTTAVAATEARRTRDFGTQTTQPTLASMPTLTRKTQINKEDIILLNDKAFAYKRDGGIRGGTDIHSRNGSATRSKNRAVASIVKSINNPKLTAEHIVLALRTASIHPDV